MTESTLNVAVTTQGWGGVGWGSQLFSLLPQLTPADSFTSPSKGQAGFFPWAVGKNSEGFVGPYPFL